MHHLDLVVSPLDQELMQNRRNKTIGVNPIVTKNNTIVTLHLDDEERGSERLASYGEVHRDDTPDFHQVAPHTIKSQVGLHESSSLPSFLKMEYSIRLTVVPPAMSILEISLPSM
jgi:hypothetical protein